MKSLNIKLFGKILTKLTSILFITIIIFTLSSCGKNETIKNPIAIGYKDGIAYIINDVGDELSLEKYDKVADYFDTYIAVKIDDEWGFIKNTGEEITDIKYERVSRMSENKAVVVDDGKTIIIDNKGETLYTFNDGITSYSYFNENKLVIEKDGLLGYLEYNHATSSFSILVEPTYNYADMFHEGFAAVGMIKEDKMKYSYLKEDGNLFISDFIYDEASIFSDGFAKVGTITSTMKYKFLSNTLSEDGAPVYLTKINSTQVVEYDYASDFSNGIAFVANYKRYSQGDTEDTLYYRWYTIVDTLGNFNYGDILANSTIMKEVPKNFFPHSPIFVENVLVFQNGYRSSNVWNFYRYTIYKQLNENDEYFSIYDFDEIDFNINQEQTVVKNVMKENHWTFELSKSLLSAPYEANNFKYNEVTETYIASVKISNDKMGIIKIVSTLMPEDKGNSLDTHQFKIEYIIAPTYDNIIY